jgi:hypothetical protein
MTILLPNRQEDGTSERSAALFFGFFQFRGTGKFYPKAIEPILSHLSSSTKTGASTFPELHDRSEAAPEKLAAEKSYPKGVVALFKNTAREWIEDKCPQLGAALAYFTVFSLAPLVLVLLAVFGLIFGEQRPSSRKDH